MIIFIVMKREHPENQFIDFMDCLGEIKSYSKSLEQKDVPQNLEPCTGPSTKRPSFKNKYINKLKQSIGHPSNSTYRRQYQDQSQGCLSQQAGKKLKNKIAAKESRDRKKIYMNIVEKDTKAMEQELYRLNKEIQDCQGEIVKTTFVGSQHIGSFNSKIAHTFTKMKKLVAQEQSEERNNEINLAVDSLTYRYAGMGKQRRNSTNQYFRHIVNLGIPIVQRYMLQTAFRECHMFRSGEESSHKEEDAWFMEMVPYLGGAANHPNMPQLKQKFKYVHDQMVPLIEKLSEARRKMDEMCQNLDHCMTSVREGFSPVQMAQFMIFQQSCRYRQELTYPQKMWNCQQERGNQPKKRLKLDIQ